LDHDQSLIDDLRIRDPQTGLMRIVYAQQTLRNEIGRSRRNNSSLCLLLAQVVDWDELVSQLGIVAVEDIKIQISEVFNSTLRMVDTSFIAGAYGAILPETNTEGALVVARRLIDVIARRSRVDLRIGIAQFPVDGVTEQALQKAAETALQEALTPENTIVLHSQIQGDAGG
jgi:GGDEF domain-containing protein